MSSAKQIFLYVLVISVLLCPLRLALIVHYPSYLCTLLGEENRLIIFHMNAVDDYTGVGLSTAAPDVREMMQTTSTSVAQSVTVEFSNST